MTSTDHLRPAHQPWMVLHTTLSCCSCRDTTQLQHICHTIVTVLQARRTSASCAASSLTISMFSALSPAISRMMSAADSLSALRLLLPPLLLLPSPRSTRLLLLLPLPLPLLLLLGLLEVASAAANPAASTPAAVTAAGEVISSPAVALAMAAAASAG